jgi:hypothetical protein
VAALREQPDIAGIAQPGPRLFTGLRESVQFCPYKFIHNAQDGIVGKDLAGIITSWNKGWKKCAGMPERF